MFVHPQWMEIRMILNQTVTSFPRIFSALHLFLHAILICYCLSQTLRLTHLQTVHQPSLSCNFFRYFSQHFQHFQTTLFTSDPYQLFVRNSKIQVPCSINPLNAELNPICYLLALLAYHFLHVSRIGVKSLTLRLLMSYIYGALIIDVSRSHTTTQHSRQDSSGRMISSSQRPLPDNTQES